MKRDAAFLNFRCFLRGVSLRRPSEDDYDQYVTADPDEREEAALRAKQALERRREDRGERMREES